MCFATFFRDHCNEKGYKILKVYQDVESGGHDDREGFVELQKQLNKKIFTKIVFWKISRIARITSTGMKFFESLDKYGITFDSISQPFIKDVMTLGIFLSIAAQERIQLSERVKSNSLERTKMGFFVRGVPPKGYLKHILKLET
ncbi:MAG: recombinase family protein [Cetobacterium sp.]